MALGINEDSNQLQVDSVNYPVTVRDPPQENSPSFNKNTNWWCGTWLMEGWDCTKCYGRRLGHLMAWLLLELIANPTNCSKHYLLQGSRISHEDHVCLLGFTCFTLGNSIFDGWYLQSLSGGRLAKVEATSPLSFIAARVYLIGLHSKLTITWIWLDHDWEFEFDDCAIGSFLCQFESGL